MRIVNLVFAAGFGLWLTDFWVWATTGNSVPWAQLLGIALIYLATAWLITLQKRYRTGALIHIGVTLWFLGVLVAYIAGTGTGVAQDAQVFADIGEAVFFIGLCLFGMRSNTPAGGSWFGMFIVTLLGVFIRIASEASGYDITTKAPTAIVATMTLYAVALLILLWATARQRQQQLETKNAPV